MLTCMARRIARSRLRVFGCIQERLTKGPEPSKLKARSVVVQFEFFLPFRNLAHSLLTADVVHYSDQLAIEKGIVLSQTVKKGDSHG